MSTQTPRPDSSEAYVEQALRAAKSGSTGHWPTVAAVLHDEVLRLRAELAETVPVAQSATELCSCNSTTVVRIHSSGSYCGDGQHERLSEALAKRLTLDIDQRGDANAERCATAVLDALRKEPASVAQSAAEPAYRCGQCGASGCRLFRRYQTFIDSGSLRCAACAAASEGIDNADLGAGQIGWYVLAVPTTPGYDSFWGYTSVPAEPLAWWRSLPVKPTAAGGAS